MANKEAKRDYPMADEILKQRADVTVLNLGRDAAEFSTRGVSTAAVTAFKGLITTFDEMPTDSELIGIQMDKTNIANAAEEALRVLIRPVRSMADIKFKGKGLYNTFGFKGMDVMDQANLVKLGKKVKRVGTTLLPQLASEGLTAAKLNAITAQATVLDDAMDAQEAAIETRDIKTQERIIKGNVLYAEFSRLNEIGKSIYVVTDEAKYNDYVIYDIAETDEPAAPPPAPL